MNDIDIDEGRRIAGAATDGPWFTDPEGEDFEQAEIMANIHDETEDGHPYKRGDPVADCGNYFGWPEGQNLANAALIVWLRNNAAAMFDVIETGRQRLAELEAHILDIDAHATPFGDIPDEPGWVGEYLVTAGALHRALGTIGHTAASCQAKVERDDAIETRRQWETIARQIVAEVDAHFAETTRYQFSPKVRLERIRDLADRTPTPRDGA